ncbi:hypothetical protein BC940DRAFT_350098 [Gongronella butleri]|nr:hypothetical protein BC940DRAFT_350098 [Gongronella butleri]
MEVNKDEAERCIGIAQAHLAKGNHAGAVKFVEKSLRLYPTDKAKQMLKSLESKPQPAKKHPHTPSARSTAPATPTPPPVEKKHTPEQAKAVKTILACGHDYYKVLSVQKTCSDTEIKKSYRKLALQFHPDKNGAPGADEAFKLISKAFTVLSDPQKRAIHDSSGGDPDSRAGPSASSSSSFYRAQQPYYANEVSPEDLFDMFFGGGGGTGMRYRRQQPRHPFHPHHPHHPHFNQQRRAQQNNNNDDLGGLLRLMPLLLLLVVALLSSLMSNEQARLYTFERTPTYSQSRTTPNHNIRYYVDPKIFARQTQSVPLRRVESQVEQDYYDTITGRCQIEQRQRNFQIQQASGTFFNIGRDESRLQRALNMAMPNCDEVRAWGKPAPRNRIV